MQGSGSLHGRLTPPHLHRQSHPSGVLASQLKYSVGPDGGTTVAQKVQSHGGEPAVWADARPTLLIAGAAHTKPPAMTPRLMRVRRLTPLVSAPACGPPSRSVIPTHPPR